MAICVVKSCRSQTSELFCAPDNKDKLKKWKMTIGTSENEFLICERHFAKENVIIEKSLTSNAFPSLLLKPSDYRKEFSCGSCLKKFENNEERSISGKEVVDIFKKFSVDIKINTSICRACDDVFEYLKNILIIQEMKKKNPPEIKLETIVIDEDEEALAAVEKNTINSNLKAINDNPPSEELSNVTLGVIKSVQKGKIIYFPSTSNGAKPYQLEPNVQHQKLQVIKNSPSIKTIKIAMPNPPNSIHDYTIPLKDASDDKPKQTVIITKRRQSAAPMTIIHNAPLTDKKPVIKNVPKTDKKIQINDQEDEIERDIPMSVLAKRRASAPVPPVIQPVILNSTPLTNSSTISRVLPTKEFQCSLCPERFQTSLILRLHEDKHTANRVNSSSTRTGLNNFKCFDCNNSFPSYYFLRRHRDTCTLTLRLKCSYQYCRFRATSASEVAAHFSDAHANKIKCNDCNELMSTPAQLLSHQAIKHGKSDNECSTRKRRGRRAKAPSKIVKRPRADLDFDSNESISCEQCKEKVKLNDLAFHVTICKKF